MLAEPRVRWTEAQFLERPEWLARAELLDGEVVVTPAPEFWHNELAVRVAEALRAWLRDADREGTAALAPLDVAFGPERVFQPDVVLFARRLGPADRGVIRDVPVLCVEVLSTSTRGYDRLTKRARYAQAGVAELWCVDPEAGVERWHGPGLDGFELVTGTLSTPSLPGFALDVPALLAP